MRKIIISALFLTLLMSVTSAEILITQQPESSYNMGDVISVPIKITSSASINNFLKMSLLCNGVESEIYKEYIYLLDGEEKESTIKIPLIKSFTGLTSGTCKIQAILGTETILTDEFKISSLINVVLLENKREIAPGEKIIIKGTAKKENGKNAQGFAEVLINSGDSTEIKAINTIENGSFDLEISIPSNLKAGQYLVSVEAYEKDFEDEKTNTGFVDYNLLVTQVPTNLEIIFDEQEINPNSDLKVKAILHDQTGEKIKANTNIILKNENNETLNETIISTDESFKYHIAYNQAPGEYFAYAYSQGLETESNFEVLSVAKVEMIVMNKTLLVRNIGNIQYNDNISIKIGEETVNFYIELGIDQEKKYILSAPKGEYLVEADGVKQNVALTGGAIGIKEARGIIGTIATSFIWLFIIGILGMVSYLFFKNGYNKTFIGYITKKRFKDEGEKTPQVMTISSPKPNKAELSLSLKGIKQNISAICLKIKNLNEIEHEGSYRETIEEVKSIAETNKAITYKNSEYFLFMLVPSRTRTMQNEANAISTAEQIKKRLEHHNRLAKDKIDYGISINYGAIVGKEEPDSYKFMSMSALITNAKKKASLSNGEILLDETIKDKSSSTVRTEKTQEGNDTSYKIKEIKKYNPDHEKFISDFKRKFK